MQAQMKYRFLFTHQSPIGQPPAQSCLGPHHITFLSLKWVTVSLYGHLLLEFVWVKVLTVEVGCYFGLVPSIGLSFEVPLGKLVSTWRTFFFHSSALFISCAVPLCLVTRKQSVVHL